MKILAMVMLSVFGGAGADKPPPENPQPAVLVSFEQVGGFAGIERSFTVYRSGKIETDGLALTTTRLSTERLRTLRTALQVCEFAKLKRRYKSDAQIDDGYTYRIVYFGRTIAIEEDAKLPPRLARVFSQLRRLTQQ
jgi:hypothetical protein